MKTTIILLTLFIVATSVYCNKAEWKKFKEECKTEAGITDEIKKGEKPNFDDPKVKCFFTCIMKKKGVLNSEGKFDVDKAVEGFKKHMKIDDSKLEVVKECIKKANEQSGCEVFSSALKCMKENGIQMHHKGKKEAEE